eukprot:5507943-Amphidinium_carterae.1
MDLELGSAQGNTSDPGVVHWFCAEVLSLRLQAYLPEEHKGEAMVIAIAILPDQGDVVQAAPAASQAVRIQSPNPSINHRRHHHQHHHHHVISIVI